MQTVDVGQCYGKRVFDHETGRYTFHVERADPRVWVSRDLLAEIVDAVAESDQWVSLIDDVLTIRATNRTVVYKLDRTQRNPESGAILAEWPD